MTESDITVDQETLTRIRERVLQEENAQLHYKRPPSIILDLKEIVEEEITTADLEEYED